MSLTAGATAHAGNGVFWDRFPLKLSISRKKGVGGAAKSKWWSLPRGMAYQRSSLKRGLDVAVGVPAFLVAAPVVIAGALAGWHFQGPPAFFKTRNFVNGSKLHKGTTPLLYKLRSMIVDQSGVKVSPVHRQPNDPRATRVGRWLRKFSVDELPQLLKVVTGEFTLVNPRPITHDLRNQVRQLAKQRKAGLNPELVLEWEQCLGQTKPGLMGNVIDEGRGQLEGEENLLRRIQLDIDNVKQASLWRDLSLLFRTPAALVRTRDAF